MLIPILIGVQVISAVCLIVFVLLHAGRGGGLSDLFGGGAMGGSMAGSTVVEKNLDRLTIIASIIFVFCCLFLGMHFSG